MKNKEFENLFMKYKGDIYRLAYTYVNNEVDALDIVQETAYQAYISRDTIRDKEKFKSWILKIAVNKSKDMLRKNRGILLEELSKARKLGSKDNDSINLFMDNLKNLSLEEKNIIVQKIYFQYTFEIISEKLTIPIGTVKSRYYRALEKLRLEESKYER
ncbi:MAG TPA: RNA polymerase sigma factor [Tissierellaceae bacterium]|nr:RNA polymerase sigma factor [Tissierellaceae bacterium]